MRNKKNNLWFTELYDKNIIIHYKSENLVITLKISQLIIFKNL